MDDPSSGTLLLLSLLGFLLVCSGCFSATETAFFCLDRIERRRLAGEKSKRSRLIVALLKRPRELLSTVLFGNTLVNVATAVTAALLFARVLDTHSLWIAVVVDTLLVLFFGEIIPKTIAVNKAPAVARMAIIPFHFFSTVSRPMVIVFDRLARIILRFLRVPEEARDALSPAELEVLFEEADQEATITSQERRIASNILRFSQTTAYEIMTPRVDIVATPLDVSRDTLGKLMIEARHSRIPVYEQSLDYIVGFVGSKEFFLNPERKISELVNPVSIFPEGAKINHIFRYMQKNLLNMAVIVDEYGVTAGIATMEDLLEEIVGEIYDEYEKAEELIRKEALDTWFVLARAPVEQVNKACGLFLPEGESVTLNGYLSNEFGRIPVPEETIERGGALFTIVESKRGRIVSCRIRLMIPEEH
ncbi:MAG: HlyC/CorC family transporter [Deltaproteobacteria bacterium]|nr:HlyC/CorC family transporter [Deltaproteobacteria bacterium]